MPAISDQAARGERARQILAAMGARRTYARDLVIDALAGSPAHLSISSIHHQVAAVRPEINISTVHRAIGFLAGLGLVHALPWPGEALYGLAGDGHVHVICVACGAMSEIPAGSLGRAVRQASAATSYEIGSAGVALFGHCPSCQSPGG